MKKIKVGILYSLSGTMAMSATSLLEATLMAITEINAQGGILGHEIEPVIEDGASDILVFENKAKKRHTYYWKTFLKYKNLKNISVASILKEEVNNILLVAKWLQSEQNPDYEFAIRFLSFLTDHCYWHQAIELACIFQSLAEHFQHWKEFVHFGVQQAKYLSRISKYDQAQQLLEKLRGILHNINELNNRKSLEAMILNLLGNILMQKGNLTQAKEFFDHSCRLDKELENWHGLAMTLNSLGGVLEQLGDLDKAVEAFRQSAEIKEQQEDYKGLAMTLNDLGGTLHKKNEYNQALLTSTQTSSGQFAIGRTEPGNARQIRPAPPALTGWQDRLARP